MPMISKAMGTLVKAKAEVIEAAARTKHRIKCD